MKIAQLETFVIVAEELHFRRAAERLSTQPSTVSTQIAQLEAEYGTPLFIRNSRNVALTPAGQTLLQKARGVLAGIADLERTARSFSQAGELSLSIGLMDEGLGELTEVVETRFRSRFPNAHLDLSPLDYQDLGPALHNGAIDVALTVAPDEWFDPLLVSNVPLFADSIVAVLPNDHRLAAHKTVAVEDLLGEPFLKVVGLNESIHKRFHLTELRDPERSPDVPVEARHMMHVLTHVARGRGILTVTAGTGRYFPRPDISYVEVTDLEPAAFYASHRSNDTRLHMLAFVQECVHAVRNSLDLFPTAIDATREPT